MTSLEQLQEQVKEHVAGLHKALTNITADMWQLAEDRHMHYMWMHQFLA